MVTVMGRTKGTPTLTPEEALVERREVMPSGCWEWRGAATGGYGCIRVNGRTLRVHRLAYERFVGSIPAGLTIDHLCRNTLCFNPSHLEPVTIRENTMRGEGFAARNAAKVRCHRGHPLSGANLHTYTDKRGYTRRYCRACRKIHFANWYGKQTTQTV